MQKWFGQKSLSASASIQRPAMTQTKNLRLLRFGLCIIGGILVVDCAALLAKQSVNIGTILPLAIGGVLVLHGVFWHHIHKFLSKHHVWWILWRLAWLGFGIWLISFVFFIAYLQHHMSVSQKYSVPSAIIILGSGTKNNQPTPVLAKRLDAAALIANQNPQALLITSGGKDAGEKRSEADIMAQYLREHYGIAASRIAQDENSTSTELNFHYSAELLSKAGISLQDPIVAVTSDFHTLRSAKIGKKQGYDNLTMVGSDTPWYVRMNVWFREYFAFISGWLLNEY